MSFSELELPLCLACSPSVNPLYFGLEFPLDSMNSAFLKPLELSSVSNYEMEMPPEDAVRASVKKMRREKACERQRKHRNRLSEHQKLVNRQKAANYAKIRRSNMSEEERVAIRERDKIRARIRRRNLSEAEGSVLKEKDRQRKKKRREYLASHPEEKRVINERDAERKKRERLGRKLETMNIDHKSTVEKSPPEIASKNSGDYCEMRLNCIGADESMQGVDTLAELTLTRPFEINQMSSEKPVATICPSNRLDDSFSGFQIMCNAHCSVPLGPHHPFFSSILGNEAAVGIQDLPRQYAHAVLRSATYTMYEGCSGSDSIMQSYRNDSRTESLASLTFENSVN